MAIWEDGRLPTRAHPVERETAMIDKLLTSGFVHVDGEVQANTLYEIYKDLKKKGHALHYAEETRAGNVLGASAYHYLSCAVCHPNRRIP